MRHHCLGSARLSGRGHCRGPLALAPSHSVWALAHLLPSALARPRTQSTDTDRTLSEHSRSTIETCPASGMFDVPQHRNATYTYMWAFVLAVALVLPRPWKSSTCPYKLKRAPGAGRYAGRSPRESSPYTRWMCVCGSPRRGAVI